MGLTSSLPNLFRTKGFVVVVVFFSACATHAPSNPISHHCLHISTCRVPSQVVPSSQSNQCAWLRLLGHPVNVVIPSPLQATPSMPLFKLRCRLPHRCSLLLCYRPIHPPQIKRPVSPTLKIKQRQQLSEVNAQSPSSRLSLQRTTIPRRRFPSSATSISGLGQCASDFWLLLVPLALQIASSRVQSFWPGSCFSGLGCSSPGLNRAAAIGQLHLGPRLLPLGLDYWLEA